MLKRLSPSDHIIMANTPLLSELPSAKREAMVAVMTIVEAQKREILFTEGDVASECFIVIDGWVRLFRMDRSGAEADIGLFGPGQSFAEAVMFLGGRFPASAQVVEPARLARLPLEEVRGLLKDDADLAMALLGSLSLHLHRLVGRVSSDRLQNAEQRLCAFLLESSEPGPSECAVRLPYDKTVLAGTLGMAPEALSRAFAALRPLGVNVEGRDIVIRNRATLLKHLD
ncbi:Crp/Fnr family transcriptional regulator [Jiella marina]|uniref:Crp/Fnr family transcriptional regulator n=1 Tax=Jiella sp. LLJ827 TaxID=2917712 RepID=UPI0021010860|nr:Crp/Fnr family transcriptional regulator [Jiella sp. LLJ827]MCQ0988817.1 Crp/Fnr family transcriptional regulator [Jiella sp. LLJ827]